MITPKEIREAALNKIHMFKRSEQRKERLKQYEEEVEKLLIAELKQFSGTFNIRSFDAYIRPNVLSEELDEIRDHFLKLGFTVFAFAGGSLRISVEM